MSTLDEVVGTKCDPVEYLKHPPLTLLVEICLPLGCFICGRGRAVAAMLSPCPFVQLMESLSASGVSSGRSLLHTRASLKCAPCWQCESSCWILSPGCVSTLLIMEDLLSQLNLPSIMLRQKLSPCPWRSRRAGPSSDHKNSFPSCWARWVTELDIWRVDRVKTVDELLLLESRLRVLRAVAEGRSCWVDPVHPLACRAVQPRLRACWTPGAAAGGSGECVGTAEHPQEDLLAAPHPEFSPSARDEIDGRWSGRVLCCFAVGGMGKEGPELGSWPHITTGSPQAPPGHCPGVLELWGPDGLVRMYFQEGVLMP